MQNQKTRRLVTSAMLIAIGTAISFICEYIPFLNLPFGGTITIASLVPLVLISYMYGIKWGLGSGFVFAVLQMAVGARTVSGLILPSSEDYMGLWVGLCILLLDYICAFTVVGLGGMFRKNKNKTTALVLGGFVSIFLCYFFHVLSGAIFYGAFAEWFFTDTVLKDLAASRWIMENLTGAGLASLYSIVYNGCYMIPEIVISCIALIPLSKLPQVKAEK